MGNAWAGDWAARITGFAHRAGHRCIWEYLQTQPRTPLTKVAATIGDAAPVQIEQMVTAWCVEHHVAGELVRDLFARSIHEQLPQGWGSGTDFDHVLAMSSPGSGLPEPYRELKRSLGTHLLKESPPPAGWLPTGASDPLLLAAFDEAVKGLPTEKQAMVAAGEVSPQPGDRYRAVIGPIWKTVSIYGSVEEFQQQYAALPLRTGHLFAVHWCQSEVRNGGFKQFFHNSTGILAPEASAGFAIMGMPICAGVVTDAMKLFGPVYPRATALRQVALGGNLPAAIEYFAPLDDRFYDALESENGGFERAADAHADGA